MRFDKSESAKTMPRPCRVPPIKCDICFKRAFFQPQHAKVFGTGSPKTNFRSATLARERFEQRHCGFDLRYLNIGVEVGNATVRRRPL